MRSPRFGGGVRRQSTAVAAVVVSIALVLGSFVLLELLHLSLSSALRTDLTSRSRELATMVSDHGLAGLDKDDTAALREGAIVQILEGDQLVYSFPPARTASLAGPTTSSVPVVTGHSVVPWGTDDPIVVALGTAWQGKPYTVIAASSQTEQSHAVRTTGLMLLAGIPLLVALAGWATWTLTGRTLEPVESIRARVETIGVSDLDARVPVPDSRDEIAALATTMNAMLARLQSAHESQRRFVADASHELRSPLATLTGALEIGSQGGGESLVELAPLMEGEAQRMRVLVDDLLLLAKADDRGLALRRTEVDLDELVERELARGATQAVRITGAVRPVRVDGDVDKLAQVLRNLVDNAVRAAHSRVSISVGSLGEGPAARAVMRVEDDGDGIPAAERARVFDRFVRLDDSRTRSSGGSGLGLSIVREIVAAHGGTIEAGASADLGGAAFTVTLPLEGPAAPATSGGSGTSGAAVAAVTSGSHASTSAAVPAQTQDATSR